MVLPIEIQIGSMDYYKLLRETLSADSSGRGDTGFAELRIAACSSAIAGLESGLDEETVWQNYLDVTSEHLAASRRRRLWPFARGKGGQ
jgi:hypothetical protein